MNEQEKFTFLINFLAQKMLMLELAYGEEVVNDIVQEKDFEALNAMMMGQLKSYKGVVFQYTTAAELEEEKPKLSLVDAKGRKIQ